ncbi:DUF6284 family protein [Promicromonospora sp. NPDC057138]|uniref:DUF6284 family protein n=1 Tax=Promicromonospora sp. NPDC057138 TaxID=3346031 RepID=UPI003624FBD6
MSTYTALAAFDDEPTPSDLAAIVDEELVIAAGVDVVDAECALAASPNEFTIRRHRRAVVALGVALRTAVETSTNRATSTAPVFVAGSPLLTARRVVIRPATRTA